MSDQAEVNAEGVDFAVLAYREEGVWELEELEDEVLADIETIATELRRWPGDHGAIGLISIDEDFFVLVRVAGAQTRLLLSDVTAATDWPLARSVVDELDVPLPEDDDDPEPAGDPALLDDLGISAMALSALLDDDDLYPDEMLSTIAEKLGFGPRFDDLVGLTVG
ncbi:MAG: tRNA adenosine deaminase-associated protein [Nocardioides sp.]|nr:tRNA adenosine deaminase-associated protein [Nocardioides sp.]